MTVIRKLGTNGARNGTDLMARIAIDGMDPLRIKARAVLAKKKAETQATLSNKDRVFIRASELLDQV